MSGPNPEQLRQLTKWTLRDSDRREGLNLGYFDTAVNAHFRSLEDGTRIFYPQGAFGRRGYVVPPETEPALRARARSFFQKTYVVVVVLGVAFARAIGRFGPVDFCALLAGLSAGGWLISSLVFWPLTRKLQRATVPNSPIAYWKSVGRTLHPLLLTLFSVLVVGWVVVGALIYARDGDLKGVVIGLFFAFLTVQYGIAVWSRWFGQS